MKTKKYEPLINKSINLSNFNNNVLVSNTLSSLFKRIYKPVKLLNKYIKIMSKVPGIRLLSKNVLSPERRADLENARRSFLLKDFASNKAYDKRLNLYMKKFNVDKHNAANVLRTITEINREKLSELKLKKKKKLLSLQKDLMLVPKESSDVLKEAFNLMEKGLKLYKSLIFKRVEK
jgi:hypothetical protein